MADRIFVWNPIGQSFGVVSVKADMLDGPWCVIPSPTGEGFSACHHPTGTTYAGAARIDAHLARRVADALNRCCRRVRTLLQTMQQRFVIEAVIAATLEGEQV